MVNLTIKGTVSRELRPMLLYIIGKLFSRPIVALLKIFILLKGQFTMYIHKTLQRKLSWVILLCLYHVACDEKCVSRQLLPAKGNYTGNYFPLKHLLQDVISRQKLFSHFRLFSSMLLPGIQFSCGK